MVYLIVGVFILFDLITGIIKSLKNKDFSSTKMRDGLFHKCGSILCVMFGYFVDYAQGIIDLGVTVPVCSAICAYICLMEVGSIIENICDINPDIIPDVIKGFIGKHSEVK